MDGACDLDPGDFEPPRTALAPTKPNFSYVALLKGYIDLNGGSQTINTQGQESCLYGTDNSQTNDGGEPLLHLQYTKVWDNDANNTPSLETILLCKWRIWMHKQQLLNYAMRQIICRLMIVKEIHGGQPSLTIFSWIRLIQIMKDKRDF